MKIRYGTFFLTEDHRIEMRLTVPQSSAAPEKTAMEFLVRTMQCADMAYPELMKAIWG